MRTVWLLFVAVVLISGTWWLLDGGFASPTQPSGDEPSIAADDHGAAAVDSAPREDAPSRANVTGPVAPAGERSTVVTGRCVAAETGRALAGCTIEFHGWPRSDDAVTEQVEDAWHDPDDIVTGDDGRFSFALSPPPGYRFSLHCEHPGRVEMRDTWGEMQPGTPMDLGDVPMAVGVAVRGRTIDEKGVAIGGVRLVLERKSPAAARLGPHAKTFVHLRSDGAGTLESSARIASGTWRIRPQDNYQLVRPRSFVAVPGLATTDIEVVLREPGELPKISGIIVDESGAPVAGLELWASAEDIPVVHNSARSDSDGTFTFFRVHGGDDPVKLNLAAGSRGFTLADPTRPPIAWDTEDVRVVVQRPTSVRVTALEAATGTPVEEYFVRCYPVGGKSTSRQLQQPKARGHHDDGAVDLNDVRRGMNRIQIYPDDPDLVATAPLDFDVGASGASLTIEVHRRVPLQVRVVLASGEPVAGTEVDLIRAEGRGEIELTTVSSTPEEANASFFTNGPIAVVLDTARTDANGTAILRGPPANGLALKVRGPGHLPVLRKGISVAADARPVVVRVALGAVVRGTVEPLDVLRKIGPSDVVRTRAARMGEVGARYLAAHSPTIYLVASDDNRVFPATSGDTGYPIRDDGSFDAERIPAGVWQVEMRYPQPAGEDGAGKYRVCALQTVTLRDGETRDLVLNLSAIEPGRIRGRLFLDGAPYANGLFLLTIGDPDGERVVPRDTLTSQRTDAQGNFDVSVPAGFVRPATYVQETSSRAGSFVHATEWAPVIAGTVTNHDFHIVRRTLQLRLLESNGKPATDRYFTVYPGGSGVDLRTDANGWLTIDPAPPDPVVLRTGPRGMDSRAVRAEAAGDPRRWHQLTIELGPVAIPPGETSAEIELRLPPAK